MTNYTTPYHPPQLPTAADLHHLRPTSNQAASLAAHLAGAPADDILAASGRAGLTNQLHNLTRADAARLLWHLREERSQTR